MKRAFVTGGNRGIGLAIAKGLADQGHEVLIGVRDLAAGDKVVVGGALKLRAGAPVEIVQPQEKTPEADQTQPDKAAGKG